MFIEYLLCARHWAKRLAQASSFDLSPRHAVFPLEGEVGFTEVAELPRGEAKTAPRSDARTFALTPQVERRVFSVSDCSVRSGVGRLWGTARWGPERWPSG